jgi:Cu(I)/Ag(I) efflux system membrane fusion protein
MNGKRNLIFLGGALITLVLIGITWWIPQRLIKTQDADPMKGMEGMDMGGMAGMDMDKMGDAGLAQGPAQTAVRVSPARRQLIGVKTEEVKEQEIETGLRAAGTVDYDERRIRQVHLRVSGWITDLQADYTGKPVKKGEPLLTLYSPDLVATQEEYLLAQEMWEQGKNSPVAHVREGANVQVKLTRNRLLLWGLTAGQIGQLERRGMPQKEITLYSPAHGVVTKKMAINGMYVTPEMNLYEITDLSVVWLYANIYEYDLSQIKVGQEAAVTLAAWPGEIFNGRVIYIAPYLNNETRTVRVRIEMANADGKLKPGMYGNIEIKTKGDMKLVIPQEAVLDSGTKKLVFVDQGGGMYEPREVTVGHKTGHFYPVLAGISKGEKVVTSGTFLIDSESKLMAATSMMGMLGMGGIPMEQAQMGEMEMGDMKGMEGMDRGDMKMDQPVSPRVATPRVAMPRVASPREQTVEGLTVTLAIDPEPPKRGRNKLRLMIHAKGNPPVAQPVRDAKVTVVNTMEMPGMEAETVAAKPTNDGSYEATVAFTMKGVWKIDVIIAWGKGNPVTAHFMVPVEK